jgi:hypothetical protein
VTPTKAVRLLSAQRAANGIPGAARISDRLSAACAKHLAYLRANLGAYDRGPHDEQPGLPGYSESGSSVASWSEFAPGAYWSGRANPWDEGTFDRCTGSYAPLHEQQLLSPTATKAWYAEGPDETGRYLYSCMGVADSRRFSRARFFSYPGNGSKGVARGLLAASEAPVSPAQLVGLGRTSATGRI